LGLNQHKQCVSKAKIRFNNRLKQYGQSIGTYDEPVMELLLSDHRCLSAYDIADKVSEAGKRVQPVQIYRSLEKLMNLGVVHRISTKNSYIACYEEGDCKTGQFLICTECKKVKEVESNLIENEITASAEKNRFLITSQTIEVLGLCAKCQKT
jgi:Fur family zinc uptake transcriptional regulator